MTMLAGLIMIGALGHALSQQLLTQNVDRRSKSAARRLFHSALNGPETAPAWRAELRRAGSEIVFVPRGLGAAVIFICFLLLSQTSLPAIRCAGSTAARAG
jgi:hypothetical protein